MREPDRDACLVDEVAEAVAWARRPLVVLLDEFDSIAAELRDLDQGEIRGALVNVPQFTIVVGMARQPGNSLEFVGDVVSDLAPVLAVAHPLLGELNPDEAARLVRLGRELASLEADPESERLVLETVGSRHPWLLHAACFAWYAEVGARDSGQLSSTERDKALCRIRDALLPLRRQLERGEQNGDADHVRGRNGARETAREEPQDGMAEGNRLMDELDRLLATINERTQLETGVADYVFRRSQLGANDEVYLRRTVSDRDDFVVFIEALSRLLYDGSDGVVANALRGKVKPKLPGCCYRDERFPLVSLIALRNHHIHLQASDPELANRHLKSAGDAFEHFCGRRAPIDGAEYERVRLNLLRECIVMLKRLVRHVPLTHDMAAEVLLGG